MRFRPDFPFAPARLPFFYGWVIAAVGTLGIVMSIPGQTMGMSVFADPLIDATGLSRLEISNAYLLGTIASGLLLPIAGSWLDRVGARSMVLIACAGLSVTLVFLSGADRTAVRLAAALGGEGDAAIGWAAFATLAVGFTSLRYFGQGMLTMVSRTMIGKWFDRRRGIVSSVTSIFVNFGFASAPLMLSLWIGAAGWRGAWTGMAVAVAAGMGVLGWLFFRDNPEECGLQMDGATGEPVHASHVSDGSPPPVVGRDYTRGEALRTGAFWCVTLGIAIQAMVGTGITFHIVDLGAVVGLTQQEAVGIFLPIAGVSVLVGLVAGWAVDRTRVQYLVMVMMVGQVATYASMPNFHEPLWRALAIGGWGLASGFYGPLTVAAMPRFFGRTHLGAISGFQMMVLVLASAAGPALLAAFRESLGDYSVGLTACATLPVAVFVMALFSGDPPPIGIPVYWYRPEDP
jgi:OFA family oxalate/formate antiporter-like MFS transporter